MATKLRTTWIPDTRTLGTRLAMVRQRQGWNIKEAAEACGLKESNWRGWELDGRLPHKLNEVAGKIAAKTGVNKYWLMDGEPPVGVEPTTPALQEQHSGVLLNLKSERCKRPSRPGNRTDSRRPKGRAA